MPFWNQEICARGTLRRLLVGFAGAVMLTLGACGSPRPANIPQAPANFAAPDAETIAAPVPVAQARTTIAPYDKIQVRVFQVEALSGDFQVNSAGQISYPLIGSVPAAGKTPLELSQFIGDRLAAKHLRSPNVQVNIVEAEPSERTVTLDGSVKTPGAYPVKGSTTLMRAVALANGLTGDANPRRVVIFRTVNGQRLAGGFDLAAIRRAEAEDPMIYPNDIVVVDGKNTRLQNTFREIFYALPILQIFRPF